MSRTYVVSGSASGIGAATAEVLRESGCHVVGVDRHDADVCTDLADPIGREHLVDDVHRLAGDGIDAVIAVAGVATAGALAVRVNYFGAVATLEGLRSLLRTNPAPRAAAVGSMVAIHDVDDPLVECLLAGDEDAAVARADQLSGTPAAGLIYASTKHALARQVRRRAVTADWAGCGIPLNLVAPGVMLTPMSQPRRESSDGMTRLRERVPMPLNGFAPARSAAHLLVWLCSEENTHLAGQIVFLDGGAEATVRGDRCW